MIRSCILPLQSMEKVNIDLCQSNNQLTKERRGQVRLEPYPSYSLSELVIIFASKTSCIRSTCFFGNCGKRSCGLDERYSNLFSMQYNLKCACLYSFKAIFSTVHLYQTFGYIIFYSTTNSNRMFKTGHVKESVEGLVLLFLLLNYDHSSVYRNFFYSNEYLECGWKAARQELTGKYNPIRKPQKILSKDPKVVFINEMMDSGHYYDPKLDELQHLDYW